MTNMVGKDGGPLPEVTIVLDELPENKGTTIRMTYDFYQILKADGTPLDGALMSKLLTQATQGWGLDMVARGYNTVDGSDPVSIGIPSAIKAVRAHATLGMYGDTISLSVTKKKLSIVR